MLGLKYNRHNMQHILNKSRSLVSGAYKTAKNFLGNVDYNVQAFKNIYGTVAPVLRSIENPQVRCSIITLRVGLVSMITCGIRYRLPTTTSYATVVIHKWDINIKMFKL